MPASPETPLLQARGLTKRFGSFAALSDVDFVLEPGEVRGLVGSNGAGKSTLVKILTGAHAPSKGQVFLRGTPLPAGAPLEMLEAGIACIYQHSSLVPSLPVLDNVFLGRQPTRRLGFIDRRTQRERAERLIAEHGIEVDLGALVGNLSTVKQKEVEILKALALNARIILMDEPTAWLSRSEVTKLHRTIRRLKSQDVGVLYISHVLDEVFQVCDSVMIMRDGRVVWNGLVSEIERQRLVDLMVGEKLGAASRAATHQERKPGGTGEVRLSCKDLTRRNLFTGVSFDLHAGEILCVAGLIGAKRSELVHSIFGSDRFDSGTLELNGAPIRIHAPGGAIASGLGLVPEDRHRDGLFLAHSVAENLSMVALNKVSRLGLLRRAEMNGAASRQIERLGIVPQDASRIVGRLSGGNQQKVMIGKWLEAEPKILILDEPTVGVDVGAKAEIYTILRRLRDQGTAVLVISSDIEEVMTLSDRIAVMVSGRILSIHDAGTITQDELVARIGGAA
ncbi:MAG TPA: sugar ABC transporter ATP-binding protein [Candidatus Methylomirabilis sp.]|nr:sugar ABC transporter ATP-binding protein [Candidatus Methylomirabilis sp.]